MKQTILKLIGKREVVYDIKGVATNPADMKEDTFYCFNRNTLLTDGNIEKWNKFIKDNTEVPVVKTITKKVTKKAVKKSAKKIIKKKIEE